MPAPTRGKTLAVFDLKATLAEREEQHRRGASTSERPAASKRGTIGTLAKAHRDYNKGVGARAERDLSNYDPHVGQAPDEVRDAAMRKKAKLYEAMQRGEDAGLSKEQRAALSVDFQRKAMERFNESASEEEVDSDDAERYDRDESAVIPRAPIEDDPNDPIIEYEDEMGRTRRARRSKVPQFKQEIAEDTGPAEQNIVYGESFQFPVYNPSPQEIRERYAKMEAMHGGPLNGPLNKHYNASAENRERGAGFVNFSQDEEERKRQQEEIKNARRDTERAQEVVKEEQRREEKSVKVKEGEARMAEAKAKKEAARKRALERAAALASEPAAKVARTS